MSQKYFALGGSPGQHINETIDRVARLRDDPLQQQIEMDLGAPEICKSAAILNWLKKSIPTRSRDGITSFSTWLSEILSGVIQGRVQKCAEQSSETEARTLRRLMESLDYDLTTNDIVRVVLTSAEAKSLMAIYCLVDSVLPNRIIDKKCLLVNSITLAQTTGTQIERLLFGGEGEKIYSQFIKNAPLLNIVVPDLPRGVADDKKYKGATVLDAKSGKYENPIAVLDFASLYPSIMMSHNLCYSSFNGKHTDDDIGCLCGSQYICQNCLTWNRNLAQEDIYGELFFLFKNLISFSRKILLLQWPGYQLCQMCSSQKQHDARFELLFLLP